MAGIQKVFTLKNALNPVRGTRQTFEVDKPKVPEAIEPPTIDNTLIDRQAQDYLRRRRGRASSIVAGDSPVPGSALATKSLLGG